MEIITKGYHYTYVGYNVKEKSSLIFKVKGPKNAHIGLFSDVLSTFNNQQFYEIVIGANSNTLATLRKSGLRNQVIAVRDNNGFLSEADYRPFWVSWANIMIAIGRGKRIGMQQIFAYNISNLSMAINFLAFSAYGEIDNRYKYNNGKCKLIS